MKDYQNEEYVMPEEKPEAEREAMIADAMVGYGPLPGHWFGWLAAAIVTVSIIGYFIGH